MDQCSVCGSTEFREELVTECFDVDGKEVIVENIPVRVCARCGDVTFSAETTERVRLMVHGEATPIRSQTVEVFAYS